MLGVQPKGTQEFSSIKAYIFFFSIAEKAMNQRTDVKAPKRYIMVLTCQIGLSKTFNIYVSVTSCLQRNRLLKRERCFFFFSEEKRNKP